MDKNGTPELVTYHPQGYNQGYLCLYTYKNGKVISLKKTNVKKAKISENCTAAGWYDTYACSKNIFMLNGKVAVRVRQKPYIL
jgi:hypothetical protein